MIATWTYRQDERPGDMAAALKDFQKAIRKVKTEYKRQGRELFWIRNIEKGTKGAWHIHIIVNEIGNTMSILQNAWPHGGTWADRIGKCSRYCPDSHSWRTISQRMSTARKSGRMGAWRSQGCSRRVIPHPGTCHSGSRRTTG